MKAFIYTSLLFLLVLTPMRMSAQTLVVSKPVADDKGMIAFQITEIIHVEGPWPIPLTVGELLYPQKRQKAHPIMRFGEAVLIALTAPGNRNLWQGLHIHNGCIPALQGKPLAELIVEMEKQSKEREVVEMAKQGQNSKVANSGPPKATTEQFGICPICHQRHIRIR